MFPFLSIASFYVRMAIRLSQATPINTQHPANIVPMVFPVGTSYTHRNTVLLEMLATSCGIVKLEKHQRVNTDLRRVSVGCVELFSQMVGLMCRPGIITPKAYEVFLSPYICAKYISCLHLGTIE